MARPIDDEGDQPLALAVRLSRQHLIEQTANGPDRVEIRRFDVTADIVVLPYPAFGEDRKQGTGMVFDIDPVPDIFPLPVNRDRLVVQRLQDSERDQLFREMVGSVI